MMVTYRLAGVDGEATEEVVDSLVDSDSAGDQDPEVKFGIARDIADVSQSAAWAPSFFFAMGRKNTNPCSHSHPRLYVTGGLRVHFFLSVGSGGSESELGRRE